MALRHMVMLGLTLAVNIIDIETASDDEKATIRTQLRPILEACSSTLGINIDDVKAAKKAGNLDTIDSCFLACVMKKTQFMNEKGLFDPEKIKEKTAKYLSNEEDLKKLDNAIKTCEAVNENEVSDGEKGCDRAKLLVTCIEQNKAFFPLAP